MEQQLQEQQHNHDSVQQNGHHHHQAAADNNKPSSYETVFAYPTLESLERLDLGTYVRQDVSNVQVVVRIPSAAAEKNIIQETQSIARRYFDFGLRLMFAYQHEMASQCFLACLEMAPYTALAHGLIALCHSPNYNFKGDPYYESACHAEDVHKPDLLCVFPSQQVAARHSQLALETVEELRRLHRNKSKSKKKQKKNGGKKAISNKQQTTSNGGDATTTINGITYSSPPKLISEVEAQLLSAIRVLTCCPGVDPALSTETVGRPYTNAMRKVYKLFGNQDPEVVYCFAESLMVLNAWQLYEYPSGRPVCPDVDEVRGVLELALQQHNHSHAGLCHLYVHLSEMSAVPQLALPACESLRTRFPDAGHLLHMATHIDVLVGDYESCVRYNQKAIQADMHVLECSPSTADKESFYFGYIVHNYHMLVFGAILGGMEQVAMEAANELNSSMINETMFVECEYLTAFLESYSALDIHIMVRFGRWKEILQLPFPKNKRLMLYRAASILYARGLAQAALGNVDQAKKEADRFDSLRNDPAVKGRILHNNSVERLLAVDAVMLRGEIMYREHRYEAAFMLLRRAVELQDELNYDEPWGKMQPIRHALGGLLLEQNQVEEAEQVFRQDLSFHPNNPFAMIGLINCLKQRLMECCCNNNDDELAQLQEQLRIQRKSEWADYEVLVPCECCQKP